MSRPSPSLPTEAGGGRSHSESGTPARKRERKSTTLCFMGKLNIELSSNSSQGKKKKTDKKLPNGAAISDRRDKHSVCAYLGCKGPFMWQLLS